MNRTAAALYRDPPQAPEPYEPPAWNPPSFGPKPIVTADWEKPRTWNKKRHTGNGKSYPKGGK